MAKRKKKRQTERVLEPLVKPGQPLKVPDKAPAITPSPVVVGFDADQLTTRHGPRMRA
jgi:hypothetical protein